MDLKDILAISGKPGLFKFISQGKNGIIVESIIEGKRLPAYSTEKVSALEDIAIFTETDEVKLSEIFDRIFEHANGGQAIDPKSDGPSLKAYFEEILPDYDKERVYVSDIKKIVGWYNLLQEKDMLVPSKPEEEETTDREGPDEGDAAEGDSSGKQENPDDGDIREEKEGGQ